MTHQSGTRLGLPGACDVAFKEWEGVCDALARGRQSLILRKGGIEERPGGFAPDHDVFWLYPTRVHQGEQGLKSEARLPDIRPETSTPDRVFLRALAVVDHVAWVGDPEVLGQIDHLHVWTRETVEKRFLDRKPGLWVLGVRVYVQEPPEPLMISTEHSGCKTWVKLSEPITTAFVVPAIEDEAFDRLMVRLRSTFRPEN
jgi:hypothetical protein